jgi:putative glycerol-1-phosphate prenyltransferase
MSKNLYQIFTDTLSNKQKLLAILIDPDVFDTGSVPTFLRKLPLETTHIFVGGSTVPNGATEAVVKALKFSTSKPILLFPGDVSQITQEADGLLFLSLISGRNPAYLIGQQVLAVSKLRSANIEVLSTGYILLDGGHESAVARVTNTLPMSQKNIQMIVDTAKAGELLGMKLIYLEAGSGASTPVSEEIIKAVRKEISIPLLVGGGIRTTAQRTQAYNAGADMVVMGTVFEEILSAK